MSAVPLQLSTQFVPERILFNSTNQQCSRRVLFVNANETARPYRVVPPGLTFITVAAERAGYDARFADLPQTAAGCRHFIAALRNWQPEYVALETYRDGPAKLIRKVRRIFPNVKVVFGGPAAAVETKRFAATMG